MKFGRKLVTTVLALTLTAALLAGCGSGLNGKKTVTTVNGEAVSLGTLAFYVKYQQASMTTMFSSMMSQMGTMFDTVADEESGQAIGQGLVTDSLDMIEQWMVIAQHAEEYGVALTDEENAKIDEIAQAYIDKNDKGSRSQVGASKEDVVKLLELMTISDHMLAPMAEDVDTEVSDEEAGQTTVTLVSFNVTDDLDAETAKGEAEEVLAAIKAESDIASADISAIKSGVTENGTVTNSSFTTSDPSDSSLNQAVLDALEGVEVGEVAPEVIEADDAGAYYIVRLDTTFDEEATENQKRSIVTERRNAHRQDMIDTWLEESEITRDEEVLATLTVTDEEPFSMAFEEEETEEAEDTEG